MKNLSYVIGCFVILIALASCGANDSQVDSSEVIPSLEVSSFRGELISIDIIDMNEDEAPYTKKTADSEEEFVQILETIDSLEFVSSDDIESTDSVNVKIIFNLQDESERVLEYRDGLVSFKDQERYSNSGGELVQLYDMLDGDEITVDEYGKEIGKVEDEANKDNSNVNEDQSSSTSQSEGNQQPSVGQQSKPTQPSAGQQSKPTQQSSDENNSDIEAVEQPDNGVSTRSVENEPAHAEEVQETETLPPLGSKENPYAEEPLIDSSQSDGVAEGLSKDDSESQDIPPMEPQDNEALPPLGSVGNEYAEEPLIDSSQSDDVKEGLSKDPELPDIPPMEP